MINDVRIGQLPIIFGTAFIRIMTLKVRNATIFFKYLITHQNSAKLMKKLSFHLKKEITNIG